MMPSIPEPDKPPAGALTASTRMKTFFAARPNESTTLPPTASCASALALKFGLLGSLDQFGAFGTPVSAPGSFAVGSSHFGGGSLPSLLLGRAVELPVGSL